jgi:hypothetical protein
VIRISDLDLVLGYCEGVRRRDGGVLADCLAQLLLEATVANKSTRVAAELRKEHISSQPQETASRVELRLN